ncbi:hypothetical protein XarbCFBP8130_19630 [Xanthomonas arboricola]|nr:hypothetical protein XarbCFBP8153_17835 [Xanthomonas arboricola]PPT61649.1 hypothetical protein XarbCFBP8130_19630 [Xanthomonas arboricola]
MQVGTRIAQILRCLPTGKKQHGSLLPPGEGAPKGRTRVRAKPRATSQCLWLRTYPHPNPRSAPRPRMRRGRFRARAPVARKPCLFAPQERGFQ